MCTEGVELEKGDRSIIVGNDLMDNEIGIFVKNSSYCQINQNDIIGSPNVLESSIGMLLAHSNSNTIDTNKIDTYYIGIAIQSMSEDNAITNRNNYFNISTRDLYFEWKIRTCMKKPFITTNVKSIIVVRLCHRTFVKTAQIQKNRCHIKFKKIIMRRINILTIAILISFLLFICFANCQVGPEAEKTINKVSKNSGNVKTKNTNTGSENANRFINNDKNGGSTDGAVNCALKINSNPSNASVFIDKL